MYKLIETLRNHLPKNAIDLVYDQIVKNNIQLTITPTRKSKAGDYRPAVSGKPARISINGSLNPYGFLLVFLHELAHHITWTKYKRRVAPHGKEWKKELKKLHAELASDEIFPDDILNYLKDENRRIYASTHADIKMARTLKKYDKDLNGISIESIPENTIFKTAEGRRFKKLKKRRKNYFCLSLDNQRLYVFSPLLEVYPLN
ncbi:MAG TPA: SprT-like domain-containing protein [Bacteroidales bacterium]|nr:SprT-like domain-containing protein [Bacteroidales bacterium]HOG66874.1 SprT-like domain-containing protein [Bacteroidales bacterium]HPA12932.1 SprT-like domain-containing protein [Bacteroidales bacterium]HQF01797.1 SprT-like domain-containing protein [Bacteroidales bacterium]HQO08150.1 SprT-like domain-containing protein [Bacteroidales bacterium]